MEPTWLRAFERQRVALPADWAGPGATAALGEAIDAYRTIAGGHLATATLAAAPCPLVFERRRDEASAAWQVTAGSRSARVTVEQLEALGLQLTFASHDAAVAVGASPAVAALLFAAGTVFPEVTRFTGRPGPVPFRHRGGPGFLGAFAAHTHHDFPIDVPPAQVNDRGITSGPWIDEELASPARDAKWVVQARSLPRPQFTYWWNSTYVNGWVVSRAGAVVWFRDLYDYPFEPAYGARLVARLQAFHAVAVESAVQFGFDTGHFIAS